MLKRNSWVLALPASQFCVRGKFVRPYKRQRIDSIVRQRTVSIGAAHQSLFEWDESERLLQYKYLIESGTNISKTYQVPWVAPEVTVVGRGSKDQLMNSGGESPSVLMATILGRPIVVPPQQQNATKCTSTAHKNVVKNHAAYGNCTSIVPYSSPNPQFSSLLDAAPPLLTRTKSLLAAVSKYMNTSKSGKRRHSPYERRICCLCSHTEDNSDRTAIHTLEELKAFVHNDVADMLKPIWNGISTLKSDLKKENSRERQAEQPRQQHVALQMVRGSVRIPDNGTFISPGSNSVLTGDSHFPTAEHNLRQRSRPIENAQSDQTPGKLPMEEFTGDPPAAQSDADLAQQRHLFAEKLKEKNKEIEALQATVHDLVGYQQKITKEFDKVKRHIFNEPAQGGRPSSFPDGRTTLYLDLLNSTFKSAEAALDSFTTCFIAYSEARVHGPANKIWKPNFRDVYLAKESHWTYPLKAFFCEKMFVGFENESFMTDAASLQLDPVKLRKESYEYFKRVNTVGSSSPCMRLSKDAHFRTFCEQKFDSIVPDAILLQPGDYDEHKMESSFPALAEINLSKSFTAAATKVWTLHKLCFAFEPAANIFRARRGLAVDSNYMESVVKLEDDDMFIPKVGLMITPGFRLRDSIVKSQIYLAAKATASQVGLHGHRRAI